VSEPCDKTPIEPGRVYTAPANYHLLVERDGTLALSVDPPLIWSRPAIDPLFESAARVWGPALTAVLLSGASADGTKGMAAVKAAGGRTLAQDPAGAEVPYITSLPITRGTRTPVAPEAGHRSAKLLKFPH
jgi:two-component system chemotaxis response regulator CheB